MKILVKYDHEDTSFKIEAVGDEAVDAMVEAIHLQWLESEDTLGEIQVVKNGAPAFYYDTDMAGYVIFEY